MKALTHSKVWRLALVAAAVLFGANTLAAETVVTCPPTAEPASSEPESAASRPAEAVPASVRTKADIRGMVAASAAADGRVPASLALAVARVESNFSTNAESFAGARGVMQIMPATARDEYGVDPDQLWDAGTNVDLGVRFLGDLYERYGRDWEAALSHYNGGALKDGVPHSYTSDYVDSVKRWWRIYESDTPALASRERLGGRSRYLGVAARRYESPGSEYQMTQDELNEHISAAKARVRAALQAQGAYD